ncbi:GLPGLI family protein [Weeksellaceae bacterium A-14]
MQIKTYLLIFFFPLFFFSQSHRFIYSYQFVPDSTKIDSVVTENTRLEVYKDHSEFLSDIMAKKDSAIISAVEKKQSMESANFPDAQYKSKVYKNKKLIYTVENIGIQPFKVVRKLDLPWKLLSETKKIQGYNCQKAILDFGGRNWEAWFTKEIPIQDGPSVFFNLPGLIVKINDLKHHHTFLLEGNYKPTTSKTNFVDKMYFTPIEISPLQFNSKWNTFRKHPVGATEQFMIMNPGLLSGKSFDNNGNEIDMTQKKREEQKYAEMQLIHNNNFLDLHLYKVN